MTLEHRRGFSLIELVAVIAVVGVIVGIAVGLVHTLFRADRAARRQLEQHRTLYRLAEHFRRDAHAARRIVPPQGAKSGRGEAKTWQFELDAGRRVVYRASEGTVERTVEEKGKPKQWETFTLGGDATATLQTEGSQPTLVALLIAPQKDSQAKIARKPVRIEAVLGMDRRFERPAHSSQLTTEDIGLTQL